ncbi:unnamed protein product [Cunninghamella blakesleeana]
MKFATLSAIALGAVSCYASAVPRQNVGTQCGNSFNACCNQIQTVSKNDFQTLSSVVNIFGASFEKNFNGQLGISCTAVGVLGAGGNQCNNQPACCQRVEQSGIFGWNCSPVNINL